MADEYIRLDTTIIAIDNLINEAATGTMARTLFKAKDTIYNQQRYVIDVQPVNQWISVNDRLPEAVEEDVNGKIAFSKSVLVYLVYDNGFTYITNDRFRVDSKSWLHEIPGEGCKVTHWMPLPEPPKE